jgi:hypothetical protein
LIITLVFLTVNADLTELSEKVGVGMKCVGFWQGTVTNNLTSFNLESDFDYNPESAEDYIILINTGVGYVQQQQSPNPYAWGDGVYIVGKTNTSFSVRSTNTDAGWATECSIQILALK